MGGFGSIFSSLTSLGGSGGLSANSSNESGDASTGNFNVGGMSFGQSNDNTGLYIALAVVVAALIIKK